MNTQIEELKSKKSALVTKLRTNADTAILDQIRAIEAEIKNAQQLRVLNEVNAKQARLRGFAIQAWECEQPATDITCNDGSFHSVKVKKYPKLAALEYSRGKFEEGKFMEISINGEKFRMFEANYQYNKPTEYTRPATFEAFLQLNNIMVNPMTIEEYNEVLTACTAINAEFKEAVKRFDAQKKDLNLYNLAYFGLLDQRNAGHIHEFSAKY